MASQDYISQFSQGIPPTQPHRSPSRTPRRDPSTTPQETSVPAFRGPLHMATTHYRNPNFGYTHTWTPPRFPLPHHPLLQLQYTGHICNIKVILHSHSSLRCHLHRHLHRHLFRDLRHLNASPQRLPNHTPPRLHPPCHRSKPDVDCHDIGKANGIDFPATVRSSKFSQYKDIEGMDPLQIPVWKFLYQGLNNTWLRRIAHGREVFVLPLDNIGTTVFIAELVQQLKARSLDLDRLAAFRSKQQGVYLQQKEATQHMAKELAQLMQSWLPAPTARSD